MLRRVDIVHVRARSYHIDYNLEIQSTPRLTIRCVSLLEWGEKTILMPQNFTSKGEELWMICEKSQSGVYICQKIIWRRETICLEDRLLNLAIFFTFLCCVYMLR